MDLVTVIVPIYNVEKYLARCVESILKQSYQNLEIILINDGSTDCSGDICNSFYDKRIKLIHQKNKGLSGARNAGLDIASGQWITFIDSDDFIAANYIERLLDICKANKVLISQCGTIRGTSNIFPFDKEKSVNIIKWKFNELYSSSSRAYRTVAWGKLYHNSLLSAYRFPEGKINEDEDTVFKVSYEAKEIAITNEKLYYYYMSPTSILRNTKKQVNFDFVDIFEERIKYLEIKNEHDLINITKKELCLRLMLNFIECEKKKGSLDDKRMLLNLFAGYWAQVSFSNIARRMLSYISEM